MLRVQVKLTLIYCQLLDDGPDKLCLLYMFPRQKYEREFTQVINSFIQGIHGQEIICDFQHNKAGRLDYHATALISVKSV